MTAARGQIRVSTVCLDGSGFGPRRHLRVGHRERDSGRLSLAELDDRLLTQVVKDDTDTPSTGVVCDHFCGRAG